MKTLKNKHLVLLACLLLAALLMVRSSVTLDCWFHLRTGQWVLEHRQVPHTDPFSWTFRGQHWECPGWIVQIGLYGVYTAWGERGFDFWTLFLVALSFIFVYLTCEGPGFMRLGVLYLVGLTSYNNWQARPSMFTYVLTAVFCYLLWRYRQYRHGRELWLLPPLMMLWANAHDGFITGFVLIGATLVGEGVAAYRRGEFGPVFRQTLRPLAIVGVFCGLAACVNPFGPGLFLHPFQQVSVQWLMKFVYEWMPPDFRALHARSFLGLALLALAGFIASRKRLHPADLILMAFFAYLGFQSRRHMPLFALVAAPVIVRYFSDLWERHSAACFGQGGHPAPWITRVRHTLLTAEEKRPSWLAWCLFGILGVIAVVRFGWCLIPAQSQDLYPVQAVKFLQSKHPVGPMYNDYDFGCYFLWTLYPDYPVYVDGRADLYGNEWLWRYTYITLTQADYEKLLDRDGVNLIMIRPWSLLAEKLRLNERWTKIYTDEITVIFQRNSVIKK